MLDAFNTVLWGYILTGLLTFTGIRLTFKTRFYQLRGLPAMFKEFSKIFTKKSDGISPFAAMSTALSGTMGTGNIIGVGAAISLGGPGALFWMLISAFLCMIIKYAEVYLAMIYRDRVNGEYRGGAMYCIINGMKAKFRPLAIIFAIAATLASFGIGAAAQSSAVCSCIRDNSAVKSLAIGCVLAAAAACVIFGKADKITRFTSLLVPIMTLTYFVGAAFVLIKHCSRLPDALHTVFLDAFSAKAAGGGLCGVLMNAALKQGFSKGMFTNEAGMGSAPIVHSAADNTPHRQGLMGMAEVFLDTVVMCSLTGLVILVTDSKGALGSEMTCTAFCKVFGDFGSLFIALCVTLFAFGAMVGWCYYGSVCCDFLFNNRVAVFVYRLLYCSAIALGAICPVSLVLEFSDVLNAFMALPNLLMINILFPRGKFLDDIS